VLQDCRKAILDITLRLYALKLNRKNEKKSATV